MREEHLALCQRKCLSGRVAFIQASLPHELGFALNPEGQTLFQQIRDTVCNYTHQQVNTHRDSIHLSSFLDELAAYVEGNARPLLGPNVKLGEKFFQSLRQQVGEVRCEQCSPPRICNGDQSDDEIVQADGHCMRYFRGLLDMAIACTKGAYNAYSSLFGDPLPGVVFSTGFSTGKPHDIPLDCFIGGVTTYEGDDRQAPYSRVKLIFQLENFSRRCFLAVPYVLFHECIAHVYKGAKPGAGQREAPEPDDPFDEGWMDLCAYLVLMNSRSRFNQALWADYEKAATEFHNLRCDFNHGNRSKHSALVALGIQDAQKTLDFLRRLPESSKDPEGAFLGLSFDFNLWSFDRNERRQLVILCNKFLPKSWDLPPPLYFNPGVFRVFRDYLTNRNISLFFNNLTNL